MLGMSERSFRRYRRRYEDDGLDGLFGRLDKASARRVPADRIEWVPSSTEPAIRAGRSSTTISAPTMASPGATPGPRPPCSAQACQGTQARRPPSPAPAQALVGMMLHQDGSRHEWLAGQAACDLIVTMDDATSEIYSAFLVEEEGTASTFRALKQVFTDKGMPSSLYTDRGSHYFHTPEAGGKVAKDQHTQVGRALHQLGIEHIAAYRPRPAAAPSAPSAPSRTASSRNWRWRGSRRFHRRHLCPTTIAASPPRPRTTAPSCPSSAPTRSHPLPTQSA